MLTFNNKITLNKHKIINNTYYVLQLVFLQMIV